MAICQVSDELAEFIGAVDEICVVDNFAKNEGIFLGCHTTLISVTPNGVIEQAVRKGFLYADWRNAWEPVPCSPDFACKVGPDFGFISL